ncbi:DNA-directed DNA polymerase [Bertholletia excelsa]
MRGGGFDPSKLHLKRELTQIRKASRALRDPGTTSSLKSPLSYARSPAANEASSSTNHHHEHRKGNVLGESPCVGESGSRVQSNGDTAGSGQIYLHNWRTPRHSGQKSAGVAAKPWKRRHRRRREVADRNDGSSSSSAAEARDLRNGGDSKSDTNIADRYASIFFKCKGTNPAPSIRRGTTKKKSRKPTNSADAMRHEIVKIRNSRPPLDGLPSSSVAALGLYRKHLLSLVDQSDHAEAYCNSENFRWNSATSTLISRNRNMNFYTYSTPALSANSCNRYLDRKPSNGDEVDDPLDFPGQQGCGIPCYWLRRSTPKLAGSCGSCCSPSVSDTSRMKGSRILHGRKTRYCKPHRRSSSGSRRRRIVSRTAQGVIPLLTDSGDCNGGSSVDSGDELSTFFGELDMEAASRFNGQSCRNQEGLEIITLNGEAKEENAPENIRSLSQKHRPIFFKDLVGQNIVVQSLTNALLRGRIAPVYLFHGPRGTGKTSTARIFAAALNCLAKETRPCRVCRECADFVSGKSRDLMEVDSTSKKGIERVRHLLKNLSFRSSSVTVQYKVIVVDECHLLPSKMWLAFLKSLEEPPPRTVFIFVTTDAENVPRNVLSRCQKYLFNKIKDCDIVDRLRNISADENLDIESDALDLIALNADGSLRDAETMLDQLSLLGKTITAALVNELVGSVSDEKLLQLLELAMSSDTTQAVKIARELMDSGVDPMALMSQLATLIMDIIAGTYHIMDFGGRSLTALELDRLKHALKLLSDAERQVRISSECSTWFTATLLQLGSVPSSEATQSASASRDPSTTSREAPIQKLSPNVHFSPQKSTSPTSLFKSALQSLSSQQDELLRGNSVDTKLKHSKNHFLNVDSSTVSNEGSVVGRSVTARCINSDKLNFIWVQCIERCHSKTLRQLLLTHGKLISISDVEGPLIAYVAFDDKEIKARAERFISSITNSFEIVLQQNAEVRIILFPEGETSINNGRIDTLPDSLARALKVSRGSSDDPEVGMNAKINGTKESFPGQRVESIIREQRLENAWLEIVEKGPSGSLNCLKPERNQILPQEGICTKNQTGSTDSIQLSPKHWEEELNHDTKLLKINQGKTVKKDQFEKRTGHYPISPSLLHNSSSIGNFSKESMGCDSGPGAGGCSGLFCWNNPKPSRTKVKQGTPLRSHKGAKLLWFGECVKPRNGNNFRG